MSPRNAPLLSALVALALLASFRTAAAEEWVTIQKGSLPIILTAPHGGLKDLPGAEARQGLGAFRFVAIPDTRTKELALAISAELEKLLGGKPYLVASEVHRKYLDPNRAAADAYETDAAKAVYETFHGAARSFVDEARAKFGTGLLLDVHGQSKHPDQLLRGTRNSTTIKHLLARHGDAAVVGPNGLFTLFEKHGLKVAPDNKSPLLPEVSGYTGGQIVAIYGSDQPGGIDAFQLEFGRNLRDPGAVKQTAASAAKAIAEFYNAYIKPEIKAASAVKNKKKK